LKRGKFAILDFPVSKASTHVLAFYAAVFSAAAPAHVSVSTFTSVLAVVVVVSLVWYGLVALALSQSSIASAYQKARKAIDRLCGGLILGLGVRQLA
jgi:threonine efflux protein